MQTTYAAAADAYEGLVQLALHGIAHVNDEASAAMRFGIAVAFSTNGVKLLAASTDKIAGIVQFDHGYDRELQLDETTGGVKPDVRVSLLRQGQIWVFTETAVVKGDPVHVRYASGAGGTVVGRFRNAAVASETIDLSAKATFLRAASAGALTLIEINL